MDVSCHSQRRSGSCPFWPMFTCIAHGILVVHQTIDWQRKRTDLVHVLRYDRIKLWNWIANEETWSRFSCSQSLHSGRMEYLLSKTIVIVSIPCTELITSHVSTQKAWKFFKKRWFIIYFYCSWSQWTYHAIQKRGAEVVHFGQCLHFGLFTATCARKCLWPEWPIWLLRLVCDIKWNLSVTLFFEMKMCIGCCHVYFILIC